LPAAVFAARPLQCPLELSEFALVGIGRHVVTSVRT
jgi:hypothetical protein